MGIDEFIRSLHGSVQASRREHDGLDVPVAGTPGVARTELARHGPVSVGGSDAVRHRGAGVEPPLLVSVVPVSAAVSVRGAESSGVMLSVGALVSQVLQMSGLSSSQSVLAKT